MADPTTPLSDVISGLGHEVTYQISTVYVPVDLMTLTEYLAGVGSDASVVTRVGQNDYTLVKTGDGDEQFSYYSFFAQPFLVTDSSRGFKLKSINVMYSVDTADLDDCKVYVDKVTYAAAGATTSAVTTTYDTAHDTAAERKAIGNHSMTITVSSPATANTVNQFYRVEIEADANNTSVFTLRAIVLKYDAILPHSAA